MLLKHLTQILYATCTGPGCRGPSAQSDFEHKVPCPAPAVLADLLQAAGFGDVAVETVELHATWRTVEAATSTMLGIPFGPLVSALPAHAQQQLRARMASKLGDSAGSVLVRTASNIARGTK